MAIRNYSRWIYVWLENTTVIIYC